MAYQQTLANQVSCIGIALHSGAKVSMTLKPAPSDSGIVFRRTDVKGKDQYILANYKNVTNTTLGTTVANEEGVSVATIEHLMAAFWGCDIDNALVELDGEEIPIMDGSSEPFVFLIECAGSKTLEAPRRYLEVLKTVNVMDGEKQVTIEPCKDFSVSLEIDFASKAISQQKCVFNSSDVSFKTDLCRARTFGFEHEVNHLRSIGLARGGSLDNAIVLSGDKVLNEGGLRYNDEFVRHKVLDCIGDFYLSGSHIKGHISGARSGHAMNNKLLHQIFADSAAWRMVTQVPEAVA